MKKIIIIGGGLSGLAAGVLLSEAGYEVEIYEARNHLGGRAYSFFDNKTGIMLDNGQHIMMGCYQCTLKFLKLIGSYDKLDIQQNLFLKYRDINNQEFNLECNNYIAPLHIVSGLRKLPFITNSDLFNFARLGIKIFSQKILKKVNAKTALEILKDTGQRKEVIESIWKPIIISAMNAKPEEVSGSLFLDTIYELFFRHNFFSCIILPKTGLSQIFSEPAKNKIISNGGKVFTGKRITNFFISENQIKEVTLSDGTIVEGDFFLSAIPHHDINKFPELKNSLNLLNIEKIKTSPIIGIYILFNKSIIKDKILFLLKTKTQVLFNKSKICNLQDDNQLLSLVISSAEEFVGVETVKLKEMIMKELSFVFPSIKEENILDFRVIKERRATSLLSPDINILRPNSSTKLENFFLLGDWTNTGLPATIESAIKSAYILSDLFLFKTRN